MPPHLISILPHKVVVDLVSMCDIMLYKVINNVLISSPLQNFPERLWRYIDMYIIELTYKGVQGRSLNLIHMHMTLRLCA